MNKKIEDMFVLEDGVEELKKAPADKYWPSSISKRKTIVVDWKQQLFSSIHNPNNDIFNIETLEGADEDDQGYGSIGDATMEHVSKMSHRLPEMEAFFKMPNGNLFRTVPAVTPQDLDGENFNKKQMMQIMLAKDKRVTTEDKENLIQFLKSEVDERREARLEKEDALDQVTIPYDQWEAMPQMSGDWDVPPTQAPIFVYAGNANQVFYDDISEDHPDFGLINKFIGMITGIDWDDFNAYTVTSMKKWFAKQNKHFVLPTTPIHLMDFCEQIASPESFLHPDEVMKMTLAKIDKDWQVVQSKQVLENFNSSKITQEIRQFRASMAEKRQRGQLVWAEIGKFGQKLYSKYGSFINTSHWTLYKEMKADFAPMVKVGKININEASYAVLSKAFPKLVADKIFFNRPYMSLEDLAKDNVIELSDVGYTSSNVVFISQIKNAVKHSITLGHTRLLGQLAQEIISYQKENPEIMTDEEWSAVWQTYRIAKAKLQNFVND